MKKVALVLLALMVLSGCSLFKPPCKAQVLEWRASIEDPINRYEDAVHLAFSTSQYALGGVIKDMQAARRDIGASVAPACGKTAKTLILEGFDSQINALLGFMENGDQQAFEQAWYNSLDITAAYATEMDKLTDKEWQGYRGVK